MKAQKLGLVLGMNMAVACLVLQGCKATRPGADNALPPPVVDPAVAQPEAAPAEQQPITVTPEVKPLPPPPPPAAEPAPSKVAQVKPLPPPASAKKHPASAAPADAGSTVVVQRGDTLSGICVRHRVKMSAVVAANPGLKPNHIRVGQKIVLPGAAVAAASEKPASDAKVKLAAADAPATAANTTPPVKTKAGFKAYTGPTKTYKVRSGDSLGKIAYESGITIRALKDMNKLSKDSIRVGQELLVPAEKVVAKPADPAAAGKAAQKAPDAKKAAAKKDAKEQAKKGGAEKKDAAAPAPDSASLTNAVETAAAAPQAEAAPAAAEPPAAAAEPAPASVTYTAKEGDDIVSIAISYGISPSRLMDLNDLKAGDSIKAGQVLKLPADAKPSAQ